jgi:hypothetical protein
MAIRVEFEWVINDTKTMNSGYSSGGQPILPGGVASKVNFLSLL